MSRCRTLCLGQLISVLYFGGTATASILQTDFDVNAPNFSAWCVYYFLALFLLPLYFCNEQYETETSVYFLQSIPLQASWKSYAVMSLVDYAAMATSILSLKYTTITSFTSLFSLQTPLVMLLSKCFFVRKYTAKHILGVILCTVGVAISVWNDEGSTPAAEQDQDESGAVSAKLVGNILVLLSTIFYALLDILCEVSLDHTDAGTLEYLGMTGFFGAAFATLPTLLFEQDVIVDLATENLLGFVPLAALVLLDSSANYASCLFLEMSESALLNIHTLSVNFLAVAFAVLYRGDVPVWLFYVGLVMTVGGLVIYETSPSPKVNDNHDHNSDADNADQVPEQQRLTPYRAERKDTTPMGLSDDDGSEEEVIFVYDQEEASNTENNTTSTAKRRRRHVDMLHAKIFGNPKSENQQSDDLGSLWNTASALWKLSVVNASLSQKQPYKPISTTDRDDTRENQGNRDILDDDDDDDSSEEVVLFAEADNVYEASLKDDLSKPLAPPQPPVDDEHMLELPSFELASRLSQQFTMRADVEVGSKSRLRKKANHDTP